MVDTNEKAPSRAGARKEAVAGSGSAPRGAGGMANTVIQGQAKEPAQWAPYSPQGCYVDGQAVAEFRVLIDGQAAAVITKHGVWVFTRVYFEDGRYIIGDERSDTVGGQKLQGIEFSPSSGLTLHFSQYDVHVPAQWCKASWRRPGL